MDFRSKITYLHLTPFGALYKKRWDSKLFFKALKQNLQVKILLEPGKFREVADLGDIDSLSAVRVTL
jgi:hypothetical protein